MKIFVMVCCVLIATTCIADVKMVHKVKSDGFMGQKAEDGTLTMIIKGGKARVENSSIPGYQIVDVAAGKLFMVNPAKKEVMVMTAEQMKQSMGMVTQLMGGGKTPAPPSIQKLGTSKTYNGYKCDEYKVSTSAPLPSTGVYCASPEIDLDKELLPFMQFSQELSQMLGGDAMKDLGGFPVHSDTTTSIMGQSFKASMDLVSLNRDNQPDSLFVVPSDFTVKEAPSMPNMNQ
jgi:hypothetical protein